MGRADREFKNLVSGKSPEEIYFVPKRDRGVFWFEDQLPSHKLHPAKVANIVNVSGHEQELWGRIEFNRRLLLRDNAVSKFVEFGTVPAVVDDLLIEGFTYTLQSKLMLAGVIGEFVRKRQFGLRTSHRATLLLAMDEFFSGVREEKSSFAHDAEALDLDFVITCRNLANYYHFVTEMLCELCLVEDIPNFMGQIYLVQFEKRVQSFIRPYIDALFPELTERVHFVTQPFSRERAIVPMQSTHDFYFEGAIDHAQIRAVFEHAPRWETASFLSNTNRRIVSQNCFESSLRKLRERALAKIVGIDVSSFPKRIWIARDEKLGKVRKIQNRDILIDGLKDLGFVELNFESYSPLEQVAIAHNAEIIIGQHGAGLTNMLFATPGAHFIEIGNFLSLRNKLSDWLKLSAISGSEYSIFTADIADEFLDELEKKSGDILPVKVSNEAANRILRVISYLVGVGLERNDQLGQLLADLAAFGAWGRVKEIIDTHEDQLGDDPLALRVCADYFARLNDIDTALGFLAAAQLQLGHSPEVCDRNIAWVFGDARREALESAKSHHPHLGGRFDAVFKNGLV